MAKDLYVKASLHGGTITAPAVLSGPLRARARLGQTVKEYVHDPEYEGDYTVTPSETAQTLATEGLSMTDDVTVEAIPDSYVGSGVPVRGPSDLYSAGAFVYAPAGYYPNLAAQSVDISTSLPKPSISVSETGMITATEEITDSAFFQRGLTAEKTRQLTQQKGKTVTPSDVEQTAVAAGRYTVGDVKVAPIPYTKHEIYFGFADETGVTIPLYCSDAVIAEMITGYAPTTYGGKEVILAQLDGVTWYERSLIPLDTQLIDFSAITIGYVISGDGGLYANEYSYCSDFTPIDPSMTFTFKGYQWWNLGFYDSSKAFISGGSQNNYKDSVDDDGTVTGTLSSTNIPANAAYIRLSGYPYSIADASTMSLIRTA